jgi:hypothetical protein
MADVTDGGREWQTLETVEETPVYPNRSGSIAKLATALAQAQGEMAGAAKDSTNPHFKSKYADLASVWDACRKPLSKHGLSILQPVSANGQHVTVTTILAHSSGEWISESLTMVAQQATPQAVGSTITYGRRYGLSSMVGIAPEDDDAEAATARGFSVSDSPVVRERAPAVQSHGATGELGPLVIEKVGPGRAGALGEVLFTNGDAVMTWKPAALTAAKTALKAGYSVMVTIKSSTSGNRYLDAVISTGLSAAQLAATKFTADAQALSADDIPF